MAQSDTVDIGYTDNPETDIETHRSLARWTSWIGYAIIPLIALYAWQSGFTPWGIVVAIAVSAWVQTQANAMRLEALKWDAERREL